MINLIGQKVRHSTMGNGLIIGQKDNMIRIRFEKKSKEIRYMVPLCFQSAIKLENESLLQRIKAESLKKQNSPDAGKEAHKKKSSKKVENRTKKKEEKRTVAKIRDKDPDEEKLPDPYYSKNIPSGKIKTINDFCMQYIPAINREIYFLSKNGGKRYKVFDGELVSDKNGQFIYLFETDDELHFPNETAIRIFLGSGIYDGKILYCEEFTITIEVRKDLGKNITLMEFTAEPWFLLQKLNARLNDITLHPNDIVKKLMVCGDDVIDQSKHTCKGGPDNAIYMSQHQPITFIWGPPGTGKTETLAKIAIQHIAQKERVLMLSYSNVSVDGAVLRICKRLKQQGNSVKAGKYLRFGYPRDEKIMKDSRINAYNYTLSKYPNLVEQREQLMAEKNKMSRADARYPDIKKELNSISEQLKKEVEKSVREASFVATTVSKAVVDKAIYEDSYDVVIFDEASMAYVPQIVFAASLAKKHFVCMGDFSQLPPIVQSDKESILNKDMFHFCRIPEALEHRYYHKWLCMLNTQYRMHPQLADTVSKIMYHGLLTTGNGVEEERREITRSFPFYHSAMGLIDLSGMLSVCIKTKDSSRVNILSAFISFSTALELSKTCEVGIITPYHAQSKLLLAMERDAARGNHLEHPISCATVHQFQGSEKDAIVYDAVECYRMPYPGLLLTEIEGNYANRLFNVALTRARGKFVTVANTDYFHRKKISKKLLFRNIIDQYQGTNKCITADFYEKNEAVEDDFLNFYQREEALVRFIKDIKTSKKEIRMDLPDGVEDNDSLERIAEALTYAKKQGVKVYIRAENKESLPQCIKSRSISYPFAITPITVIDKKIVWYNMPYSEAIFKTSDGNIPCDVHPLIRFKGYQTAKSIYGFLEMNRTIDQSDLSEEELKSSQSDNFAQYVLKKTKCPKCGKPMCLKKNKKGRFYLACTGYPNCEKTQFVDEALVENYFYRNNERGGQRCPQCNCSLSAKLRPYGLYVECGGEPPHRYKLDEI